MHPSFAIRKAEAQWCADPYIDVPELVLAEEIAGRGFAIMAAHKDGTPVSEELDELRDLSMAVMEEASTAVLGPA